MKPAVWAELKIVGRSSRQIVHGGLDPVIAAHRERLYAVYLQFRMKSIEAGVAMIKRDGVKSFKRLDGGSGEARLNRRIREAVNRNAEDFALGVSETTRDRITAIVAKGAVDGLDEDEIAQRIEDKTGGAIGRARAQTIARTETHSAMMEGTMLAAQELVDEGIVLYKTWVSAEDERTRESHAEADGQTVEMDDVFEVGDAQLSFPGDTTGPPEETINCRCVVTYSTTK
jgi:SPP1 gp7 family putative phage head morphogenesis protein